VETVALTKRLSSLCQEREANMKKKWNKNSSRRTREWSFFKENITLLVQAFAAACCGSIDGSWQVKCLYVRIVFATQ